MAARHTRACARPVGGAGRLARGCLPLFFLPTPALTPNTCDLAIAQLHYHTRAALPSPQLRAVRADKPTRRLAQQSPAEDADPTTISGYTAPRATAPAEPQPPPPSQAAASAAAPVLSPLQVLLARC